MTEFVPGVSSLAIPVDALFLAAAQDPGFIFSAVIRMAQAGLGVDDVTLTQTRAECWVDAGVHLESECTKPESIYMRWYVYQPTGQLQESGSDVTAEVIPTVPARRTPPESLLAGPDPAVTPPAPPAKGKGKKP